MSQDIPRKTITITRKPSPSPTAAPTPENAPKAVTRTGKRIITRAELPNARAAIAPKKTYPPKKKPNKPATRKPRQPPKPPKTPPSDLRARELSDSLNAFAVWREHQPLALGVEKQIFRIIADLHLSASKRVVQKLMHYHTHNRAYLQAIQHGGNRSNLDGTDGGAILPHEREHAARALEALVIGA